MTITSMSNQFEVLKDESDSLITTGKIISLLLNGHEYKQFQSP